MAQPQAHDVTNTEPLFRVNAELTNGVAPGYWPTAGSGLTLNLSAGTANIPAGTIVSYAGGTLTMTNSTTNYVYLDATGTPASNTTGFTSSLTPIAEVVTSGGVITTITDVRTMFFTGGSGGGVTAAQVQDETYVFSTDTGTANAYVTTRSPAPTLVAGLIDVFIAAHANTGASTLNDTSTGVKTIKKGGTTDVVSGDIVANQIVIVVYDGTYWQMSNPSISASGLATDLSNLANPTNINDTTLTFAGAGGLTAQGTNQDITLTPSGSGKVDIASTYVEVGGSAAKGDILASDATALKKLAVGSDGQALVADSTQSLGVKWANAGSIAYPAGVNVVPCIGTVNTTGSAFGNFTVFVQMSGYALMALPASWKISIGIAAAVNATVGACKILKTDVGSLTVLSSTTVKFGGSATPTLAPGLQTSDAIALQLDASHDWWIAIYFTNATSPNLNEYIAASSVGYPFGKAGYISTDHTGDTTIPSVTVTEGLLLAAVQSA